MRPEQRVVTRGPLTELWDDTGLLTLVRQRQVDRNEVTEVLRHGAVRFVVADIGHKVKWIPANDCYSYWKEEVKPHLADPEVSVPLEEFPGEYCYFASEWRGGDSGAAVILLERHH